MTAAQKPCLDCGTPISVKKTSGRCPLCYRKHYRKVKSEQQRLDTTDTGSVASTADGQETVANAQETPAKRTCKDCGRKLSLKRKSSRCKNCKVKHSERKARKLRKLSEQSKHTEEEASSGDDTTLPKCSDCNEILDSPTDDMRCARCEKKAEPQVPEHLPSIDEASEAEQPKEDQPSDAEQPKEDQPSDAEQRSNDKLGSDTEQRPDEQISAEQEQQSKEDTSIKEEQQSKDDQPEAEPMSSENERGETHFAETQDWRNNNRQESKHTCSECGTPIPENFTTRLCLQCEKYCLTEEDTDVSDNALPNPSMGKQPVCRDCGSDLPYEHHSNQCPYCYHRHLSKTMPKNLPKCTTCGTRIPENSKAGQCKACYKAVNLQSPDPAPQDQQAQCDICGMSIPANGPSDYCVQCDRHSPSPEYLETTIYPANGNGQPARCSECNSTLPLDSTAKICSECAIKPVIDDPTPTISFTPSDPLTCIDCQQPVSPPATSGRCFPCFQKLLVLQNDEQLNGQPNNGSVNGSVNGSINNGSVDNSSVYSSSQHSWQALPKQCTNCNTVMLSNTWSDQCQKCSRNQTNGAHPHHLPYGSVLPKCRGCGCPISTTSKGYLCVRCFASNETFDPRTRRDSSVHVARDPVIAACGMQNESWHCKSLTRKIVSGIGLVPLDISVGGKQVTVLVHPDALSHLTDFNEGEPVSFLPHPNYPATKVDKQKLHYIIHPDRYTEINEEQQELLSSSWQNTPTIKYAVTDLLSGCVIVAGEQVLKVLCLEPYGYKATVDIQWERFGESGKTSAGQGEFANWYGRYAKIAVGILDDMLLIVTLEGTFLVTASVRLDKPNPMCDIGPFTHDFTPSRHAKIYISNKSAKTSRVLNDHRLYKHNDLIQLRDVRTKFSNKSTYHLCRGASFHVHKRKLLPYTLWTLADVADENNAWEIVNSRIFQTVALSMIYNKCQLYKEDLEALLYGCSQDIGKYLRAILDLFKPGHAYILILKNAELNKILEQIAISLGPAVDHANATVKLNMRKYFAKLHSKQVQRRNADDLKGDEE